MKHLKEAKYPFLWFSQSVRVNIKKLKLKLRQEYPLVLPILSMIHHKPEHLSFQVDGVPTT